MNKKLEELYNQYKEYRNDGLTHKEALDEFTYLPPTSLSHLTEYIENVHINGNVKVSND